MGIAFISIHDNIASCVSVRICGLLRVLDAGVSVEMLVGLGRRAVVRGAGRRGVGVEVGSSSWVMVGM